MKRSWITYIAIIGLAGIFCLLGFLQYFGLKQITDSDGEKAHRRLQEQTERFASDFNREIQNAYFNFQTDSESWKRGDWSAFNERYDYWHEKTAYPELIADFYFFEASGVPPRRYDRESRAFVPAEPGPDMDRLKAKVTDRHNFKPVDPDDLTLALPIQLGKVRFQTVLIRRTSPSPHVEMPEEKRFGVLVIRLDADVITNRLIPELTSKYFGEGDYRLAVVNSAGVPITKGLPGEKIDAVARLFDLSHDNLIQFSNKDALSTIGNESRNRVMISSRIETTTFPAKALPDGKPQTFNIQLDRRGGPADMIFTSSPVQGVDGAWLVELQHGSGSLDGYVASTFVKYLAVGYGLLFLMAAAIGAIIFSAQRAKRLAQRQVEFVSSVSHEFRTPLAVICTAGENLADGVTKEGNQVSRYGNLIVGEGKKLSSMVEQILNFAGASSGRKQYNFAETRAEDVVSDTLHECRPLLDEKQVELETDIDGSLPMIKVDRRELSGALQNLVINAVKYGNGSNRIKISVFNGGHLVRFAVEDQGIGISKNDLRHVFEPFFRSKDVVDAQIHGNGLGLSLVKQIVVAHHGRVFASSSVGSGSTFVIEIPGCSKAD